MNTFFKSLTAATVAVTIAATTLAAPAEAKVRGRDVAAGIALGVAAAVIVGGAVHHHARPVHRHGSRRARPVYTDWHHNWANIRERCCGKWATLRERWMS